MKVSFLSRFFKEYFNGIFMFLLLTHKSRALYKKKKYWKILNKNNITKLYIFKVTHNFSSFKIFKSISLCRNNITSFFLAKVYFLINPLFILLLGVVCMSSTSLNYLFLGNNEFKLSRVLARLCTGAVYIF